MNIKYWCMSLFLNYLIFHKMFLHFEQMGINTSKTQQNNWRESNVLWFSVPNLWKYYWSKNTCCVLIMATLNFVGSLPVCLHFRTILCSTMNPASGSAVWSLSARYFIRIHYNVCTFRYCNFFVVLFRMFRVSSDCRFTVRPFRFLRGRSFARKIPGAGCRFARVGRNNAFFDHQKRPKLQPRVWSYDDGAFSVQFLWHIIKKKPVVYARFYCCYQTARLCAFYCKFGGNEKGFRKKGRVPECRQPPIPVVVVRVRRKRQDRGRRVHGRTTRGWHVVRLFVL